MALLDFGRLMRAAGQTIQGLPENAGVMGGLSLLSANQPGQRNPVDQPGSFLKGMLQANSLKQNRLALEEAAKEKARQEAMRIQREQAKASLMATLPPQQRLMYSALGDNSDVIKSMIASQNPKPAEYTDIQYEPTTGRPFGYNKSTGVVEYIPMNTLGAQNLQMSNGVPAVSAVENNGLAASGASDPNGGFMLEKPMTAAEKQLQDLQIKNEENELKDRQIRIEAQKEKETIATKTNAASALRTIDAVNEIQNILDNNPENMMDFSGPTGKSSFFSFVGGTDAKNVDVLMNTIAAAFGFSTLAEMREASPGGGALGAINEKEMELLINSVIALDQGMSRDLFEKQLGKITTHFTSVLDKTPDEMLQNLATGPAQSTRAVPNKKARYGYTIVPLKDENGNEIRIIKTTDDGEIIASNGVAYR